MPLNYTTMKYVFFAIAMSLTAVSSAQNLKFEGKLTGLTADTKVILSDLMGEKFHDTATVGTDVFSFDRQLPGAGLYVLRVGLIGKNPENRTLYLDNGKVVLSGERSHLKEAELSGEKSYMKDWLEFDRILQEEPVFALQKRQNDTVIMLAGKTGSYEGLFADTAFARRSMEIYPLVEKKKLEVAKGWLAAHPDSDINAYIIYKYLAHSFREDELKYALAKLSPASRRSLIGKKLIEGSK